MILDPLGMRRCVGTGHNTAERVPADSPGANLGVRGNDCRGAILCEERDIIGEFDDEGRGAACGHGVHQHCIGARFHARTGVEDQSVPAGSRGLNVIRSLVAVTVTASSLVSAATAASEAGKGRNQRSPTPRPMMTMMRIVRRNARQNRRVSVALPFTM